LQLGEAHHPAFVGADKARQQVVERRILRMLLPQAASSMLAACCGDARLPPF